MPEDVKHLRGQPKGPKRSGRQLGDREREQREEELTRDRQRERKAWEQEKRRLGL